jgi:hypothetical protein
MNERSIEMKKMDTQISNHLFEEWKQKQDKRTY